MKDLDGNISISKERLPCEQPFQRMLITYEGRVSMCCYDWGATHPVGYVDKKTFNNKVMEAIHTKTGPIKLFTLSVRNFH